MKLQYNFTDEGCFDDCTKTCHCMSGSTACQSGSCTCKEQWFGPSCQTGERKHFFFSEFWKYLVQTRKCNAKASTDSLHFMKVAQNKPRNTI